MLVAKALKHPPGARPGQDVRQGLVGGVAQRQGQFQPLHVAIGQFAGRAVRRVRQSHLAEQSVGRGGVPAGGAGWRNGCDRAHSGARRAARTPVATAREQ